MTPTDILFEPIKNIKSTPSPNVQYIRQTKNTLCVEIEKQIAQQIFSDLAMEVMDHATAGSPELLDVRLPIIKPHGVVNLKEIVERFYHGIADMWISRPHHMSATQHKFTGVFGYTKACRMPQQHQPLGVLTWYWVDTDDGQLPAVDLGLLVVHPRHKWYRVFTNQTDATSYYQS